MSQVRAKKKKEYADRGVNLTYLAFIAKAVADALRRHPGVNAAVSGESTILRRDINLGIAVALDWGLIVPVIRHADELSLLGLARAINDLGERARTKKLSPDEVQKGTFTITNPGRVRLGHRHPDHQPAAGGDPLRRGRSRSSRRW